MNLLTWFGMGVCLAGPHRARSEHFEVRWSGSGTTAEEVAAVLSVAERAHALYLELLGVARVPDAVLTIRLDGDGVSGGKIPRVSADGEIHLVRYPGAAGGYDAALAHEIVHAVRFANGELCVTPECGFVEDGLAEFLALRTGLGGSGFPNYGFPLDLVVGQYLARQDNLSLVTLMFRPELNASCAVQAYPLRASFFRYLEQRFGFDAVLALADADPPSAASFPSAVGASFEDLAADWRPWALARFEELADAQVRAEAYRAETPVRYLPCTTGP